MFLYLYFNFFNVHSLFGFGMVNTKNTTKYCRNMNFCFEMLTCIKKNYKLIHFSLSTKHLSHVKKKTIESHTKEIKGAFVG
jgi:hypothetical protein